MLEEQHLKLARIITSQDEPKETDDTNTAGEESRKVEYIDKGLAVSRHDFAQPGNSALSAASDGKNTSSARAAPTSLATARLGSSVRDSSPSLARDIASRRGIPLSGRNPPSAAAQARARQLSPESHRHNRSGAVPLPKIPPSVMDSQTLKPAQKLHKAEDDDAFSKFYNTMTTGTMSKLSSVLAYAGLPLTADDIKPEPVPQPKLTKQRTVSVNNEPDVKNIFSKAALNAIEDEHRQRGHQGHAFGPAESFYVVQTGGGTYSYADIAKAQQQQLGGIDEDDEESFVDAREAQMPDSPRHSRFRSQGRGSFGKSRTHEELELENTTLKHTLEQLATRLTEFETHAQDASMAALTQSMVSVKSAQPLNTAAGISDPALLERLRQVEKQLEQQTEDNQRLQEVRAKQEKTLKKYQSKWEEIKTSAKEKQKAKAERKEKEAEGSATASTAAG